MEELVARYGSNIETVRSFLASSSCVAFASTVVSGTSGDTFIRVMCALPKEFSYR